MVDFYGINAGKYTIHPSYGILHAVQVFRDHASLEQISIYSVNITLQGTNISPIEGAFEDWFPFPKVGICDRFRVCKYIPVPWILLGCPGKEVRIKG